MSFVQDVVFNTKKKLTKEELIDAEDKRLEERDNLSKMVTGIFKNIEAPGGDLTFSYRRYKEDPIRTYSFLDGQKYTIPLHLAKHINNQTAVPERDYVKNADGTPQLVTMIKSTRQRYQFLSTEYM